MIDIGADGGDEAVGEARLRAERRPGDEGDDGDRDDGRHEPARDLIGEPLDRRARALRLRDHLDDARDQRVTPDLAGAHHERARLVERAGDHLVAGGLAHRHRFARNHRFVDRGAALDDLAVDRHFLAGPHPQIVADRDLAERHFLVAAVGVDAARRLGREREQRFDGARGRLAGAQLQHLAEQHQDRDDRRRLEIDRDRAVIAAERLREDARRKGRGHAVAEGDADAERDQREHVEIARDQRLPAAREERRARPQHHRCRERQLDPVRPCLVEPGMGADDVRAHLQHEHRQRERQPDPEPPGHVGEFRVRPAVGRSDLGFQRHAADRAGARPDLANLGMHRAGVDRAVRHRFGVARAAAQVFFRVGRELGAAAAGAEVIGMAAVRVPVRRGVRIDRHAADRVERRACGRVVMMRVLVHNGRLRLIPLGGI
jgi:hypothetical protein